MAKESSGEPQEQRRQRVVQTTGRGERCPQRRGQRHLRSVQVTSGRVEARW